MWVQTGRQLHLEIPAVLLLSHGPCAAPAGADLATAGRPGVADVRRPAATRWQSLANANDDLSVSVVYAAIQIGGGDFRRKVCMRIQSSLRLFEDSLASTPPPECITAASCWFQLNSKQACVRLLRALPFC